MAFIDDILNGITMYRVVLYYLIALLTVAVIFSFLHIFSYDPLAILFSTGFLVVVSWVANKIFAYVFEAPANVESVYITALILALIITPSISLSSMIFLGWVAVLSMASKYIFAINKKHIFNPAAIAVMLTALWLNLSASWWVGNLVLLPFVIIGGLLVVRKIRRVDMVFVFFLTALLVTLLFGIFQGADIIQLANQVLLHSSLFFFAFVMLTEPLTTPPTWRLQVLYGALVGFLFVPQIHIGSLYSTPELALIAGNIFSYIVSPKLKLIMKLKEKIQISPDTFDFLFSPNTQLSFAPGQYMEWTLQHPHTDRRGNRRYFTIASSPTEKDLRLGVKFYQNSSSFKKNMLDMSASSTIVGSQLAGDFTLPTDKKQKLAFIAGGIGITPFRSMLKYLIDKNESRDIVMIYSNKYAQDVVYVDVFEQARRQLGIRTLYTLTDKRNVPQDWGGYVGRVDAAMIKQEMPDFMERTFYISGPHIMVDAFDKTLREMGVPSKNIVIDFFPGFA